MPGEFSLKSNIQKKCLIMNLSGYLNYSGGAKIAKEFEHHSAQGIKHVIMDLQDVRVVNSIGISYLIEIVDRLQHVQGKLYFINSQPAVEKTFSIMGLFNFAVKASSLSEALKNATD